MKGREHKVTIDKMNLENDECLCESRECLKGVPAFKTLIEIKGPQQNS